MPWLNLELAWAISILLISMAATSPPLMKGEVFCLIYPKYEAEIKKKKGSMRVIK